MEKSNTQIDFSRKKRLGEIMNETYRLVSGNYKMLSKLSLIGVIPAAILSYIIIMIPGFNQFLLYSKDAHPLYTQTSFFDLTLILNGILLLIVLYLNMIPFRFMKNVMLSQEGKITPDLKNTVFEILKSDIPKGLLLFIVLIIPAVITVPIALYAYVPFSLVIIAYMMQETSLWKAIKEGFSLGTRFWARSIVGGLAFLLVAGVLLMVFMAPYFVMLYARGNALAAGFEGEEAILPGYFNALFFCVGVLLEIVGLLCNLFGITALTLHFYNLKARREEQLQAKETE